MLVKSPLFASLCSAILLILCWPTWGIPIWSFFALIPLFIIEDRIRKDHKSFKKLRFFLLCYLTFLLWNLGTTWWIVNATVFGMVFAVLCNSLFFALLFLFFYWAKSRSSPKLAYLFLISLWLCFEKLHLHWDLSWPWLNLGNVFSEWIWMIQWYEFTGVFGGTLWILILNVWFYEVFKKVSLEFDVKKMVKQSIFPISFIFIPCLISLFMYTRSENQVEEVRVLLLQPNIDSYDDKYSQSNLEFLDLLAEMTYQELSNGYDIVVTPETYFAEGNGEPMEHFPLSDIYNHLLNYLSAYPNTQLLSGFQFYRTYKTQQRPHLSSHWLRDSLWVDFYNSAIDLQWGFPVEYYHKSKLVVGVENLPFKKIIRPLFGDALINLGGTIVSRTTQKDRSVFSHGTKRINSGPIICYESIYGEFVTGYIRNGANLLAVLTNDSWWGKTPGHKQLLSYTRLRAIETRRNIIRSANTGISAIIDSKGRITSQLDYNQKGILTGRAYTSDKKTFYVTYGDYLYRISGLVLLLIALHLFSIELKKINFRKKNAKVPSGTR
ncbi:MAG: apolipoprotein N-acyltransferase [Flavobacteriaceae bacterium]|nr:apolipoprotein N-acyltransferase [Flavobacteriaceae bacterium]